MSADLPMAPLVPPSVEPTTAPAAVHFLAPRELVVLDGTLPDADVLRDAIAADRPHADLLVLDPARDALEQIGDRLAGGAPVSAIHLVAHGQSGQFVIRGAVIDASELARRTAQLQTWKLADHADILLYGCNIADGANGEAFVRMLAELTDADVAASTDLTGTGARGGDWVLEFVTGDIDTATIAGPRLKGRWHGTLDATGVAGGETALPSFSTPLAFERNAGQTDGDVEFLARGSGYTVFLDDGDAVIDVRHGDGTGHVVRLSLDGAQTPVASAGGSLLSGTSHYLVGDASDWHREVAHYGSVLFDEVYDGIDVQYYGADRRLEYDFLVDAGVDTEVIGLRIEGAVAVEIAENGELVLTLDGTGRTMTFHAPVTYQRAADGSREHVDSRYVLRADGTVGFVLGDYDRSRDLVIDPILGYATYLGGTGLETIEGVETDSSGNVYVTGRTGSAAFPTSVGAYDTSLGGSTDAFVTKFNSAGALQYSTYFGGSSDEWAYNLTVDGSGQIYVVGETASSDFAIVNGADSTFAGSSEGFLVKLNAAGSAILYSTYYGGANADYLAAVHMGPGSTVYVAGGTIAATWDGYGGAIDTGASGAGSLTWSQTYAAAGTEKLYDMDVDSTGDIWLAGETSTASLAYGNAYDSTHNGSADVFLVRMSSTGTVEYVSYYGGTGNDYGNAIVVAADNTLYFTGLSYSTGGIASTGAYDTTGDGTNGNAFLVHLDPSQTGSAQRLFGTYYGTAGSSAGLEIAIDAEGRPVVAGQTSGTVPTTVIARDTTLSGSSDGFVAVFAANGSALRYGTYLGGDGTESANSVAVDTAGRLYVVGQTASTTFHTTGAYDTTGDSANADGFIAQFLPLASAARTSGNGGLSINTDGGNDAYLEADNGGAILGGRTELTLEFDFAVDTGAGTDNRLLSYAVPGVDDEVSVHVTAGGQIVLTLENATLTSASTYTQLLDGDRHQLAITWSRATGNGAFHVDGALVESFSGFKSLADIDSGGTLVIGQDQDTVDGGYSALQRFSGTLYDVRVFSDVRTATEIRAGHLAELPRTESGLVAHWRFDDWHTDGTTTEAVSGNDLTLGHASGTGFVTSQPSLTFVMNENAATGTVVGSITALSDDRQARIDALLAADATLTYSAQTDKFYKRDTTFRTWASALSLATSTTLNTVAGQLVTVRSTTENALLSSITGGSAVWLGAADASVEGTWRWYDGSTPADTFWQGTASGYRIDGAYTNWNAGEPSDTGGEDRLYQQADGTWNDAPDAMTSWTLIEWDADEVLDASQTITYAITSQTVNGAFAIDSDTGALTVANGGSLNYGAGVPHTLTVRVTEGSLTYDRTYTVVLTDEVVEVSASTPGAQSVAEDATLTFSSGGGNAISVSDGSGASNTRLQVSLSVSQGTLSLSQTTGLTIVSGANGSAEMVVDGTESALNAALAGMTYTPTAQYAGSDTLQVTTSLSAELAARYTFDTGSVADSAAGTAQNGSFVGDATTTTDATRGTVLALDGAGDSAQIASVFGSPSNITVGGWVNLYTAASRGEMISLDDRVHIALDESGIGVKGSIQTGAASWNDLESGRFIAGDGWHHVMFVVDDANDVNTLYIDGIAVASETNTSSVYWTGATTTYLGQHPGNTAYLHGLLDDMLVYTRALSADEVAALAAEQRTSDPDTVTLTVNAVNDAPEDLYFVPELAESSLTGVYTFSAASDLGRDAAGEDAAMMLYGSPGQTAGPTGSSALDLAGGVSGQYGDIAGITTGGAMTIAGQVRFDSTGDWQRIVDFGQANSTGISAIYVGRFWNTNDLTFTIERDLGGGNWSVYRAIAAGAITNGTWMHFAATVDGSGAMALYVNGVLADSEAGVVPEVGIRTNNFVGRSNWAGDALFDGAIDNLVVASGAMSAVGVAALYQQGNAVTIAENAADGTVLGTIVVADIDSANTHTLNLASNPGTRFAIAADGTLTVANGSLLDYESATSHAITARATDSGSLPRDEVFTVTLTAVNEAPSFGSLNGAPVHTEGGAAVVLDADATVSDPELSAGNDFSGATLTLARNGGANADDALAFDGTNVTTVAENIFVGGVEIGDYVFTGGELVVTFGANATQARVNTLLRNIVYWNWSDAPPATVQIDWTFDDGNAGSQGSGGALQAAGSTTLTITAANDAPVNTIIGTLTGHGPAGTALPDQGYELKSDQPWGQTFSHVSGSGTYSVDDVQIVLYRAPDAPAGQTITVSLRSSWNGAVIASGTISSNALSTAESWVDVVLSAPAVLTDGQTYVLRVDSTGAEKVYVGVDDGGTFAAGDLLDKDGVAQAGKDLAFLLDAPLWTYRDGTLVLASGGAGALSVADADASTLQVTLSVQDGVVTLAQTTGISFTTGDGAGDGVMTFTGTVAAINAALDGLTFEPDAGFSGIASVSLTTSDLGGTGTGGTLTDTDIQYIVVDGVNDAPTAVADTAVAVEAGGAANGSPGTNPTGNVLTNDTDPDTGDAKTVIGVVAGVAGSATGSVGSVVAGTHGSITIAANGSFTYTVDDDHAAVQALRTAADTLTDTFTYTLQDGGGLTSTAQITVTIQGADDAPAITLGAATTTSVAGAETRVNTTTANDQTLPQSRAVAADADGDFVVVWSGAGTGDTAGVFGQRFDADGNAIGGEFRVNTTTTGTQTNPAVAMTSDGAFVVVWNGNGPGDSGGIFGQRYDASGTAAGGEFRINTTSNPFEEAYPAVSVNDGGAFVVAWQDTFWDNVYAQRFDANGTAQGAEIVVGSGEGSPFTPGVDVGIDAGGGFVVAWASFGSGADSEGIYVRRYDATGTALGAMQLVNQTVAWAQTDPSLAVRADGSFVVAWTSQWQDPGTDDGVYARLYDATGTAAGHEFRVAGTTTGTQWQPAVAALAGGGFAVAWTSDASGTQDVRLRMFDADGVATAPGESTVNTQTTGAQNRPSLAAGGGALIAVWNSAGQDGAGAGVYLQRMTLTASTGHAATFTEGAGPVAIASGDATVADVDSAALQSMTVTITNRQNGTAETLGFDTSGTAIAGSYDSGTGILSLTGAASAADYRRVLRTVTYNNGAATPGPASRVIEVTAHDGTSAGNVAISTIAVALANDAPAFSNLDGTPAFTENGAAVVLDANVTVGDVELTTADDFDGASLTLARNGGASAQDQFSATGTLGTLTQGGNLVVAGTTIGTVTTHGAGSLVLTFNGSATNALVNSALQQIAYANSSDTPPASVQIDWTFSDGNAGAQGSGGALTATGSTTVNLTATNDVPTGAVAVTGNPAEGETLSADTSGLADADGLGTFAYQWLRDGAPIAGATASSHTLVSGDVGRGISVRVLYTDGGGTSEQITSAAVGPVTLAPTLPVNTAPANATPVEDTPFAFTGADTISIADGDGNLTTVSASVSFGSLVLTLAGGATVSAGALGSAAFTLSGSLAALNASLASLAYTPDADFDGTDTLTLVSTDATALSDTDTITLSVTPVDDAPVLTGLTLSVSQGGTTTLSTVDFTIVDPDGPGGTRVVDVRNLSQGMFELTTAPGVPVTSFDFADVAAGLVRFVHSGAGAAPSFEASVRDSLTPGTFVPAAVGFTPTPVVTTPGPSPEQAYSIVLTPVTPPSETPQETSSGPARPADPVTTGTASQSGETAQGAGGRGERSPGSVDPRILMQMAVPRTPAAAGGDTPGNAEAGHGAAMAGAAGGSAGVGVSAPTAAPLGSSGVPAGAQVPTVEAVTPEQAQSVWNAPAALTVALPGATKTSGPENRSAEEQQFDIMVNGVRLTGVSLSVGVVTWALRAGGIVSSLLASLPAWRFVDPLPVLERAERARVVWRDDEDDGDGDDTAKRDRAVEDLFGGPS